MLHVRHVLFLYKFVGDSLSWFITVPEKNEIFEDDRIGWERIG